MRDIFSPASRKWLIPLAPALIWAGVCCALVKYYPTAQLRFFLLFSDGAIVVLTLLTLVNFKRWLDDSPDKTDPVGRHDEEPLTNYGNHVSRNHGTVTQVGGGSSSRTKSGMVFSEARTVVVNGHEFTGRKIERLAGRILVDDRDVTDELAAPASELLIVVQGDVSKLEVFGSQQVTINGNAGSVTTTTGSITITGGVAGSVESTTGSITCGKVGGNVNAVMGCVYPSRS